MTDYIHGFTAAEQQRLSRMQDIVNDAELAALDLRNAGRILDVGAGLGQMSRRLCRAAGPASRVLAIERDERQLREAVRQAEAAGEAGMVESAPVTPARCRSTTPSAARSTSRMRGSCSSMSRIPPRSCSRWWRPCVPAAASC
jgi:hypothetical protein